MKLLAAAEIAHLVGGRLAGDDVMVGPEVKLDSRAVTPGSLFVATPGARVDGHDFVAAAAEAGAAAAFVSRLVDAPLAQIVVPDTTEALAELARRIASTAIARGMISLALTGSSGKTGTKDMLAQILEREGPTVSPRGSYNSQLGLPVTVTGVDENTRYLVAEMGASGVGHIRWLCAVAQPSIAAVLNVGHAHIGEFGSQQAIAKAKGEIVEALPASGWAVLNADDPLVAAMSARTSAKLAWFSASGRDVPDAACWIAARDIRLDDMDRASFHLIGRTPDGDFAESVSLATLGAHQVANACAAAGLALCAGVTPARVAAGLTAAVPRSVWRMEPHQLADGTLVLNDAYNANPDSVAVALASLARLGAARPSQPMTAVLGDMLELGDEAPAAHQAVGRRAAEIGAAVLAVGDWAADIVEGARLAGGEAHAMERSEVADWLLRRPGGTVLIKGSRGVGLETIVDRLQQRGDEV